MLVVQRLNGNVILRAQLLLVQIDVIFMQAQNCLYYYKVAVDEALKQILQKLMFLQRKSVLWNGDGFGVLAWNEESMFDLVVQGLLDLLVN